MLKGIPAILSPQLLKVLCEMGHGDTIVFADAHFPAQSVSERACVVRYDGVRIPELLTAVLTLFPLDRYDDAPVTLMKVVEGDIEGGRCAAPIWDEYGSILQGAHMQWCERYEFYDRARSAYCIVATGETQQYANIILRKGVVRV
ncbi:RbsD/FucU family protein [Alloscardovia macacae]|uniref:Fucose isomerase n=1 Tax=Alloscardovia macacae TaxID=1160091 RepID=A0A261F5B4_9BIFI|nr:RbsD/FucU domain-containing protein [Alloscardovia macacae]OZG54337.1 fucose isomerase [Alloscardovia macacae]